MTAPAFTLHCFPYAAGMLKCHVERADGTRSDTVVLSTLDVERLWQVVGPLVGGGVEALIGDDDGPAYEPDWERYSREKAEIAATSKSCNEYDERLRELVRICGV